MSELNFIYIGWVKDSKTNTDKVWTAFKAGDNYYAGWGRRDKSLSFKKHGSEHSVKAVMRQKQKRYKEVDTFQLFTVFPYFQDEVEKRLLFCKLTNNIR